MRAALASMEPLDGKCFNRIKNRIYQNFDICGSCPPNSGYAVNFNIRIGAPERFYSGENIALEHIFGEIRLRVFYIFSLVLTEKSGFTTGIPDRSAVISAST